MFKKLRFILIVVVLIGCSPVKVSFDYNPESSFGEYRSYAFLDLSSKEEDEKYKRSSLTDTRIVNSLRSELTGRGYEESKEESQADFLVAFHTSVEAKIDLRTTHRSYGYRHYRYSRYPVPVTEAYQYDEGSLIVDFVDAKTKELFWRGVARKRLRERDTPEERQKTIQIAVQEILNGYPPKA